MTSYFDLIMIPLQLLIVFFTIYYFVISWFGLFGKMKETKQFPETKSFALIVCAHNEQQVIAQLVENLKNLHYSRDLYDIFVVADNCQDRTAEVARKAGAIVYERFSETGKGKGFAMDWMFRRLFGLNRQYDGVCIFDADNLVHPDFLKIMNNRLCSGERLIQGIWTSKIRKIPGFPVCFPFLSGSSTMSGIWRNTIWDFPVSWGGPVCVSTHRF